MIRIIALCLLLLTPNLSAAEDVSQEYLYQISWSGFNVGKILFKEERVADKYTVSADISSQSIARYVWKYSSLNIVEGLIRNGKYVPEKYQSNWWRKKQKQEIKLGFSKDGDVVEESLVPPERVGKRPEVGDEFKKAVFDPVSTAIVSRETIREKLKNNPDYTGVFTIPTFDAKRRFDVECTVHGYANITFRGKPRRVLKVSIERLPIAGFREKDLKEMREQKQVIEFYLDEGLMPIWGNAKAEVGRATITLLN